MKKLISLSCILLLGNLLVFSQVHQDDKNLNWRQKLKKANELLDRGSYYNAIDYYKEILKEKTGDPDIMFSLGMAYYGGRDYQSAEEVFKTVFDNDNKKYRKAEYYYALMAKMNGKYQESFDAFKDFSKHFKSSGKEGQAMKKQVRNEYKGCELAMQMLADTSNIEITHMSDNINALYTEFSPRLMGDSVLIFGSLKVDSIIVLNRQNRVMPKARLYESEKIGDVWAPAKEMPGPFNKTRDHTGNGAFSLDGKRFYYTQCSEDKGQNVSCDIYVSDYDNGKWSNPKKLSINDNKANDTHPWIGPYKNGDEVLYFSSNREGGNGGMDIWYSVIKNNGKDYDAPRNIGRRINTAGDEITPFFDNATGVLYFSSNGQINVGGFDIFKTKGSGRSWAKPINVGFPINSPVDDMYYVQYNDGENGYLVSNRIGTIAPKSPTCCDDIWSFEKVIPPIFNIMGFVYEKGDTTKTPIDSATIQLFYAESNSVIDSAVSDLDSMYDFFRGTEFKNYRIEARKAGYTAGINTTSTVGLELSDTLYVNLYLTPIRKFGKIILRNVYFDFDKAFIREDAKPSLDTIYNVLIENPNIKIELSSHTDSRGSKEYNRDLSQRRADSSRAYLIGRGINPERIVSVGYGEDSLLNNCADGVQCTEIEHQLNRRTEFKVIGEIPNTIIEYDKSEIENVRKKKEEGILQGDEELWEFGPDENIEEETPPPDKK